MQQITAEVDITHSETFIKYFADQNIRVTGEMLCPLFASVDIANKIKDSNMIRKLKSYSEKYLAKREYINKQGHKVTMNFLTEKGLYRYLLKSNSPAAEEFQEWVYDRLCEMRLQIVNSALLEAKIAKDNERLTSEHNEDLSNNLDMMTVSFYDEKRLDSCPLGLMEFHIARYIASAHFNNNKCKVIRKDIPNHIINILHSIARSHFRVESQEDYKEAVAKILWQYEEKLE